LLKLKVILNYKCTNYPSNFYNILKQGRIEELDALRGIAALLVVFFHFTMNRPQYDTFFKIGVTGVDLFFIISGFVIFMSIQKVSNGIDFVVNRISRLYPTYWAAVIFTFILTIAVSVYSGDLHVQKYIGEFFGNLTMFQFYMKLPNLDGPYWTMIIEMIFYIAILVLFQLNLLKYIKPIGIIACASIIVMVHYFSALKLVQFAIIELPLLQYLPLFFAGIVFYKIYTQSGNRIFNYTIIIFCMLSQIVLFPFAGMARSAISWPLYSAALFVYFTLFTLFVNFKLKLISNRLTLFFGKISYALYLTHQYISLFIIIPLFYVTLGINFWVVAIFIDLPIIIAIAAFITYKIELPYSKKLKNKLYKISSHFIKKPEPGVAIRSKVALINENVIVPVIEATYIEISTQHIP